MTDWTIDLGRFESGQRMVLPVPGWKGAHWLVGASTGAGKTWTVKLALDELMGKYGPKIAYAVVDPDYVNYKTFAPRASTIGFGAETALDVVSLVEREMIRRFKFMWANDIEEWSPEVADRVGPFLILVIEEFKAVSSIPKPKVAPGKRAEKSAVERIVALAQRSRKTGGGLILATQFPNVDTIPNDIRAQCAIRWCGRTKEPEQTKTVLGSQSYPCHVPAYPGIPLDQRGTAYVDDGFVVRRGRTDGLPPDVFAEHVLKYAADRTDFGWPHILLPDDLADEGEETA